MRRPVNPAQALAAEAALLSNKTAAMKRLTEKNLSAPVLFAVIQLRSSARDFQVITAADSMLPSVRGAALTALSMDVVSYAVPHGLQLGRRALAAIDARKRIGSWLSARIAAICIVFAFAQQNGI